MKEAPPGAQEAIEEIVDDILNGLDRWRAKSPHNEAFDAAVILSALTNTLVMVAMKYKVPPTLVMTSVANTIELNAAVMEQDDNMLH